MDMDMQHGHGHGHAAWTWSMEHGHGHAAWKWARSMDLVKQSGSGQWTCMDAGMLTKSSVQHHKFSV